MINSSDTSTQLSDNTKPDTEEPSEPHSQKHWYVMRDLKRAKAKLPAYKMLETKHLEVFTPMKWQIVVKQGKRMREQVPFIKDLLFVHSDKEALDDIVEKEDTLQYRYVKGGGYCEPMVVRDKDMDRFMNAVNSTETPVFYSLEEITTDMIGRKALIVGGPLDGYEVSLLKMRGSKKKRILIDLPNIIAVSVEVSPEFIQLI